MFGFPYFIEYVDNSLTLIQIGCLGSFLKHHSLLPLKMTIKNFEAKPQASAQGCKMLL